MALADEIERIRDRTLSALDASHDSFEDTKVAWRIVRNSITAGEKFRLVNDATGTTTTEVELAARSAGYVTLQLTEATFQQFLAIFEAFYFDLLQAWLLAYPQNLGGKKLDFKAVLEAEDKEALTRMVVAREVNELSYERPAGWFVYLETRANLGLPSAEQIARFAGAKATRDALVNSQGVVGSTYLAKAGPLARFDRGDRVEVPEPYHRAIWELLKEMVASLSNAALGKLGQPDLDPRSGRTA